MTKYQLIFTEMTTTHDDLFKKFKDIHDLYVKNDQLYQDEFNKIGKQVIEIVRFYEKKLCGKSESGKYAKFSGNLADKLWNMVRVIFPKIDYVGVKIS